MENTQNIAVAKLKEILLELASTTEGQPNKYKSLLDRASSIANKKFGANSGYYTDLTFYRDIVSKHGLSPRHIIKLTGIVKIMIDDIELSEDTPKETSLKKVTEAQPSHLYSEKDRNKVFVVHGHNETMQQSVARCIERLGLKPIILHEQANNGDTIMEKFVKHSNVGFAVVLLSADDYGYSKNVTPKEAKLRARQNVIFELGFFTGKIGRKNVVAIFEQHTDFEKPSDIDGVIYIPFDNTDGKWQMKLVQELQEVGYEVDANKLTR